MVYVPTAFKFWYSHRNPLTTALCTMAFLAACGQGNGSGKDGVTASGAVVTISSNGIFAAISSAKLNGAAVSSHDLFARVGDMSFTQYYDLALAKATNDTVSIDGAKAFNHARDTLVRNHEQILALSSTYGNLREFWAAHGITNPEAITPADFKAGLQQLLGSGLDLTETSSSSTDTESAGAACTSTTVHAVSSACAVAGLTAEQSAANHCEDLSSLDWAKSDKCTFVGPDGIPVTIGTTTGNNMIKLGSRPYGNKIPVASNRGDAKTAPATP